MHQELLEVRLSYQDAVLALEEASRALEHPTTETRQIVVRVLRNFSRAAERMARAWQPYDSDLAARLQTQAQIARSAVESIVSRSTNAPGEAPQHPDGGGERPGTAP